MELPVFFVGESQKILLMVQKSCDDQLRLVVYLIIHEVLCMPGTVQDF